jgi:hypothetical protein
MNLLNSSELLDKILQRPALYVGHESIKLIRAFIDGYEYATNNTTKDVLYANFTEWVAKRFNIMSMHDWASIISFMAVSEKGAFEMTIELWNEYKSDVEKQHKKQG